jgi:Domain of unknown function (DUF4288)
MQSQRKSPFIALLVYVTHVEGGYTRPRYSEDIALIHASSEEEARTVAESAGRGDEICYSNEYGESVEWTFLGVADVRSALYETLDENITLYSRSFYDLAQYKELFSIPSF